MIEVEASQKALAEAGGDSVTVRDVRRVPISPSGPASLVSTEAKYDV
jgi:hypothetical protein